MTQVGHPAGQQCYRPPMTSPQSTAAPVAAHMGMCSWTFRLRRTPRHLSLVLLHNAGARLSSSFELLKGYFFFGAVLA